MAFSALPRTRYIRPGFDLITIGPTFKFLLFGPISGESNILSIHQSISKPHAQLAQ